MSQTEGTLTGLSPQKRALLALEQMKAKLDALQGRRTAPIAIVGVGCRFPGGVRDINSYWRLLRDGVDAISEVPHARWDLARYYDPDPSAPGRIYARHGGFLDGIERFDAALFGISPREARAMDPQQRLLLEVTWEALEDAGALSHRLSGSKTGVYVGITTNDYAQHHLTSGDGERIDAYAGTGCANSIAAGRIAYVLGLQGPAMSIDTACSSSLVALHLACQSLRDGACDLAVAGGVNALLTPTVSIYLSRARALSPTGRCRTFDAGADGYVRGEGCGMVALKRLADAVASGDRILAVIRGSAVNNDGRSNGLTAPSGPSQQQVLRDALAAASVNASQIGFIETHGTGTPLGDPIEFGALAAVYGVDRDTPPVSLGSVKTNIGHLEAAAGIAGLIKTVLCLRHGEIPANLHFRRRNPHLDPLDAPLVFPTALTAWPASGGVPRLAAISSFGFSGTNAHIVVEEAIVQEQVKRSGPDRPVHVLPISARTPAALSELAARYVTRLGNGDAEPLADVCHTAAIGRIHLARRAAIVASTSEELRERLAALPASPDAPQDEQPEPRVAFLFTGQGSQYLGMARRLRETEPSFRDNLDRCDEILKELGEPTLSSLVYDASATEEQLTRTRHAQPALFSISYSLASLWRSWGVEPVGVLGHSVGEYAAACFAGAFPLDQGLRLIVERARAMQELPGDGRMLAVNASEAALAEHLAAFAGRVSLAAVNGPEEIVVAGMGSDMEALEARLTAAGVRARRLTVSHAFHSAQMDPMLATLERAVARVEFAPLRVPVYSNLDGRPVDDRRLATADYWRAHTRGTVRYADGIRALHASGVDAFIEVGPAPVLVGLGRRILPDAPAAWLPSLRSGRGDWEQLLESLGALYVRGARIDWEAFDRDHRPRRKVALPTYPFEPARHWIDRLEGPVAHAPSEGPLLPGRRLRSPAIPGAVFETTFELDRLPLVADHRILGEPVVNLVVHLALAARAFEAGYSLRCQEVQDLAVLRRFTLSDGERRKVQAILDPLEGDGCSFSISAEDPPGESGEPGWTRYVVGKLRAATTAVGDLQTTSAPIASLVELGARCPRTIAVADFYSEMARRELDLGPTLQLLDEIHLGDGEAVCRIRASALANEAPGEPIPFGVIDACFQAAMVPGLGGPVERMIVGLESFRMVAPPTGELHCHAELRPLGDSDDSAMGRFRLLDGEGHTLIEAAGILFRPIRRETVRQSSVAPRPTPPKARRGTFKEALAPHAAPEARAVAAEGFVRGLLAEVSGVPAADIRVDQRLQRLGMDSFMAIELVSRLEHSAGTRLSLASVLQNGTLGTLSAELLARTEPAPAASADMEEGVL